MGSADARAAARRLRPPAGWLEEALAYGHRRLRAERADRVPDRGRGSVARCAAPSSRGSPTTPRRSSRGSPAGFYSLLVLGELGAVEIEGDAGAVEQLARCSRRADACRVLRGRLPRGAGRPRRAAMSASLVRTLPIASRSTSWPSSRVCERKISPLSLTRRMISSLSSSLPTLAEAHERERAGRAELPARLRSDPLLEERRQPDVLADDRLQAFAAEAAQRRPERQGPEPAAERRGVLAQADHVLVDPQVLGHEAEGAAEVVRAAAEQRRAPHRREEPLVGVDPDRVGAFPAGEVVTQLRAHRRRAGIGGIDVEPGAFCPGAVGDRRDRIDRRRRGRADGCHHRTGIVEIEQVRPQSRMRRRQRSA